MKILLLSLPGYNEKDANLFPLGIGYLVGALKSDHQIQAHHYGVMKEAVVDIDRRMNIFKPDIVGLTCSTFNRAYVRDVIYQIRKQRPDVMIVVGGVHASFCYEQVLQQYGADVVVIGEGEFALKRLCKVMEENGSLGSVKGIAYKSGSEVIVNPHLDPVATLDDLPMPDYTYAKSFMERSSMGFIITSRGCPVRCTFCSTSSYWGQKVRTHSISRVVDEMEMLILQYGVTKIFFHDDTFNLGIERVKAICKEILDRKIKTEWACSCRVAPVSDEMIAHMVEAGCRHICWGIESGSQEMLSKINKKISLNQIRLAYDLSKKYSSVLSTGAYTMVGNPGESSKTVQATVNFLNTIPITDRPSTSILYVLPGTLLYEDLRNAGKIQHEDWVRYDTVPNYTLENSFLTLNKWCKMVSNSGNRIPFERKKHFWYGNLETSDLNSNISRINIIEKFTKIITMPRLTLSKFRKLLPAGRIRF